VFLNGFRNGINLIRLLDAYMSETLCAWTNIRLPPHCSAA
jgi:hypothetical protein